MNDYFLEIFYVKKQCSKTFRYDIHRFIPLRATNSASLEESKQQFVQWKYDKL